MVIGGDAKRLCRRVTTQSGVTGTGGCLPNRAKRPHSTMLHGVIREPVLLRDRTLPLAVANSVGELAAHLRVERLRPAIGEESVAHSHSHLYHTPRSERVAGCWFLYAPAPLCVSPLRVSPPR